MLSESTHVLNRKLVGPVVRSLHILRKQADFLKRHFVNYYYLGAISIT